MQSISGLAEEFAFDFAMYEWRFGASVGLSPGVSLEAAVPLRVTTTRARYRDSQGRNVSGLPADDLHPEERTDKGLGDASLDLRWRVYDAGGAWVDVIGGATLPLGSTAPDPWLDADSYTGTVRRSFFGTGTFDPGGGVDAGIEVAGVDLTLWARGRRPLYENRWGYRAGARAAGGVIAGAGESLGIDPVYLTVAASARHAGQAAWSGRPALNSGRTDLLAGFGVAWRIDRLWSVDLTARRPMVSWVEGGQVQWPLIVGVGLYFVAASEAGSAQQEERSAIDTASVAISSTTQATAPSEVMRP